MWSPVPQTAVTDPPGLVRKGVSRRIWPKKGQKS